MKRLILASVALLFAGAQQAQAQLDSGEYKLQQDGQEVGRVFVPKRDACDLQYVEYWYLYDSYEYVSQALGSHVLIFPAEESFEDYNDFLINSLTEGGRLITVNTIESRARKECTRG